MKIALIVAVTVGALLNACATRQAPPPRAVWNPSDEVWQRAAYTGLQLKNSRTGTTQSVPAASARNLYEVKKALETVSGVRADLALIESPEPNAFAFEHQGRQYIATSIGFVEILGGDRDGLATTLGHELGHVKLGHRAARRDRAQVAQGTSQVLGTLLSAAGVPFGSAIAGVGVNAVATAYSRDEERAADEIGLQWAVSAGFDPCGAYRTIKALQRAGDGRAPIPFLSTHPSHAERTSFANEMAVKQTGRPCTND